MSELNLSIGSKQIVLALSDSRKFRENTLRLIREIQSEGHNLIIIAVNNPSGYLMDLYEKNGIDTSRLWFIDAITRYAAGKEERTLANCVYVNKPGDLTSLSIAVSEILKKRQAEKPVIFLDSVNALLIYINTIDLSKFFHFVVSKLRILNISGIFLAVEKGLDPVLISQLTSFADEVVDISEINETETGANRAEEIH
jgi:hypothetical protein